MKSVLVAILDQVTILNSDKYKQSVTTSTKEVTRNGITTSTPTYGDTDISRKAQTKSIHVIRKHEVLKFLKEYNDKATNSDAEYYFKALVKYSKEYTYRIGSNILIKPSTLKIEGNTKFIEYMNSLLMTGTAKSELTELDKTLFDGLSSQDMFAIVSKVQAAATEGVLKDKTNLIVAEFVAQKLAVGHSNLSSNISFLINTGVVNAFSNTSAEEQKHIAALGKYLDNNIASILTGPIYSYITINQVNLIRHFKSGAGDATISFKATAEKSVLEHMEAQLSGIARHIITETAPQLDSANTKLANGIENKLRKYIPIYYKKVLDEITKDINKIKKNSKKLIELQGSRSLKQMAVDSITEDIVEVLSGAKKRKKPSTEDTTVKSKNSSTIKKPSKAISTNTKKKDTSTTAKVVSDKPPALRNLKGHFTSTANLQVLMQQMLHDTIQKNMQRPNLHYQTGRFAKSVKVEGITRARDGALTAFLSYMRYPYATFEAGGKQGDKGYYPSRLINQSAREIATKLTKERFTSVTVK